MTDNQIRIFYKTKMQTEYKDYLNKKGKLENFFHTRYDQKYKVTKVFTDNDGRMRVRYRLLGGCQ